MYVSLKIVLFIYLCSYCCVATQDQMDSIAESCDCRASCINIQRYWGLKIARAYNGIVFLCVAKSLGVL